MLTPAPTVVETHRTSTATTVAAEVATRLLDRDRLRSAVTRLADQTSYPEINDWQPYALAGGEAGLAVMCSALAPTDPAWDHAAHAMLAVAARSLILADRPAPGLFDGAAGVVAATYLLSAGGSRYGRARGHLERWFLPFTTEHADGLVALGPAPAPPAHDLISGLVGLGVTLLVGPATAAADRTLDAVCQAVVRVAGEHDGLPWLRTSAADVRPEQRAMAPHGYVDCGLAHGLPGLMAFLALAHHSRRVPGDAVPDALRRVSDWVAGQAVIDPAGVRWPRILNLTATGGLTASIFPSRPGWCYGDPGVARALWLAADALDDDGHRALALAGIRTACRPEQIARLASPTLCHGLAGLLLVLAHFAWDTGDPEVAAARDRTLDTLLERYDERSLLGYRDVEVAGSSTDNPGLLDGAAGVAAALVASVHSGPPPWSRLFLLG